MTRVLSHTIANLEIRELVGVIETKNKLKALSFGLYRDDGRTTLRRTGRTTDQARKNLLLKQEGKPVW